MVAVNVAMYAHHSEFPLHEVARHWFEESLSGAEPVAFTSSVIVAFLRLSTSRRVVGRPIGMDDAVQIVGGWLESQPATIVEPGRRYWSILRSLLIEGHVKADMTSDAHLAAVAIEHGAELVTSDRDFAKFPSLRVHYIG